MKILKNLYNVYQKLWWRERWRCIFEVDIEFPKNLFDLQSDLQFFPERTKIKECNTLACNLYDKKLGSL